MESAMVCQTCNADLSMLQKTTAPLYPTQSKKKRNPFGLVIFLVLGVLSVWVGVSLASHIAIPRRNAEEYFLSAQNKYDAGKYNETIAACIHAIDLNPDLEEIYLLAADACLALSDPTQALMFLESGFAQTQSPRLANRMDSIQIQEDGS
jgi:tetratricopeptide (TPR) repeat protein